MENNSNGNVNANENPDGKHYVDTNHKELPEIVPKEEVTFSRMDMLKMIFGGYLAMLPALIALILAFVIVYFLIRQVA